MLKFFDFSHCSSVHSLSCVGLLVTPWTVAHQASLSITNSWSLPKQMSLSRWCHSTISSSVIPFSSHFQSFPASGSFWMSQFFASGGQSILGLGQILSKPAFICHLCSTLPRTLLLPPVTVTRGKVVVVWPLRGHNSKKSTCVEAKPFPWELIALQSILWPIRSDYRDTGVFFLI